MPQATQELRDKMFEYFGDAIDTAGPLQFLASRGFRETQNACWIAPMRPLTSKERECLEFLVEEWDYGGVSNWDEVLHGGFYT